MPDPREMTLPDPREMQRRMFGPLVMVGADGVRYEGCRPGLVPKPMRSVCVQLGNGDARWPTSGEPLTTPIAGYDAVVNVVMEPDGAAPCQIRYRLLTLYADGRRWQTLIDAAGSIVETGWYGRNT